MLIRPILHQTYARMVAFLALVIMLSVTSRFIPPMQSPDEGAHHARAYGVAQGFFLLENIPGKNTSLKLDPNLIVFINGFLPRQSANLWGPNTEELTKLKQLRWSNELEFYDSASTGYKNPLIYLPQAFGIWLGQQLNFTVYETYYTARFFSLTASLTLIFIALMVYLPNPLVIGLLVLPMSIFQIMMPTADGICYGLTLLVLCLFSKLHAKQIYSIPTCLLFVLSICFLVSTRIYTFPALLLILFLPKSYKPIAKIALFTISSVVCISWLMLSMSNSVDLRVSRPLTSLQIVIYYLTHPLEWLNIFLNTIISPTQLEFYGKGFIGILGWLHIDLPRWYYHLGSFVLVYLATTSLLKNRTTRQYARLNNNALVFIGVGVLMIIGIFNGLLVGWTPFPSNLIEGVQGRYFWIPACFFAFSLNANLTYSIINITILLSFLFLNIYIIIYSYSQFY